MKRPSRQRTIAEFSKSIDHKLSMYAIAAGAAGVGMLALSRSAEAKVVYTPAHINLGLHHKRTYLLDLNHDGIADFTLSFYAFAESGAFESTLRGRAPTLCGDMVLVRPIRPTPLSLEVLSGQSATSCPEVS